MIESSLALSPLLPLPKGWNYRLHHHTGLLGSFLVIANQVQMELLPTEGSLSERFYQPLQPQLPPPDSSHLPVTRERP